MCIRDSICKEKQINIVNVGTAYCDTDTIKAYKENGLFVYAAVVNDISYFDKLRDIGVDLSLIHIFSGC